MTFTVIFCLILLFFGFLYCFFGYRYLRTMLSLFGFIAGSLIMFYFISPLMQTLYASIISILVGVIVGALSYFLYVVGIFFTGAGFGAVISLLVLSLLNLKTGGLTTIIVLVAALLFGILTLINRRFFIILSSSFNGATLFAQSAGFLIYAFLTNSYTSVSTVFSDLSSFYSAYRLWVLFGTLVLTILGIVVQFAKTAPKKKGYKKR